MKRVIPGLLLLTVACGGGGGEKAADGMSGSGSAPAAAAAPLGNAQITGAVSFTGTAPANPTIDMTEEPVCKAKYTSTPTDPRVVVANGKLANVFVHVKSGLPAGQTYATPQTATELDQTGCLYHPRVFGVMVNQDILIKNNDAVLHNIKAVPQKNRGFNISQPAAGMTSTRAFPAPEMAIPFECNVHGWMHARVFVMEHPYFTVTAPDGSFRITGLPAGTYELEAWHETLGTKTATVTVGADGTATAAFTFSS